MDPEEIEHFYSSLMDCYKLDGKQVVPATILEWAALMEDVDARTVMRSKIGDILISTVFLGYNHSIGGPVPELFETAVFDKGYDQLDVRRYSTWDEAEKGHLEIVDTILDQKNEKRDIQGTVQSLLDQFKDPKI